MSVKRTNILSTEHSEVITGTSLLTNSSSSVFHSAFLPAAGKLTRGLLSSGEMESFSTEVTWAFSALWLATWQSSPDDLSDFSVRSTLDVKVRQPILVLWHFMPLSVWKLLPHSHRKRWASVDVLGTVRSISNGLSADPSSSPPFGGSRGHLFRRRLVAIFTRNGVASPHTRVPSLSQCQPVSPGCPSVFPECLGFTR